MTLLRQELPHSRAYGAPRPYKINNHSHQITQPTHRNHSNHIQTIRNRKHCVPTHELVILIWMERVHSHMNL